MFKFRTTASGEKQFAVQASTSVTDESGTVWHPFKELARLADEAAADLRDLHRRQAGRTLDARANAIWAAFNRTAK